MPVQACSQDGMPGYRWGPQGTCYTYDPASATSRERARAMALAQGQAILASIPMGREATVRPLRETPVAFMVRAQAMTGEELAREAAALAAHLHRLRMHRLPRFGRWAADDFTRALESVVDHIHDIAAAEEQDTAPSTDDDGAHEAVQRAVEALVEPLCGRVVEASGDDGWPVVIIEAGVSGNRNFWPASLLRSKAQEALSGAPVEEYEIARPGHRDHVESDRLRALPSGVLLNPVGQMMDVQFEQEGGSMPADAEAAVIAAVVGLTPEEVKAEAVGRLVGRFVPDVSERGNDLVARLRSAESRGGLARYLGFSVDFERAPAQVIVAGGDRPIRWRQDIDLAGRNVVAVVTEQSAGGRFIAA